MKLDRKEDVTAKDVKRLLLRTYRDLKAGELSDVEAYRQTFILNNLLKAIELTDLDERLGRIERILTHE